ncbi:hypothetical protein J6590_100729 [Homalodisca vitripennis]|nr:hypothetical protein J6590_100729 [Homalodisca vitripennis]
MKKMFTFYTTQIIFEKRENLDRKRKFGVPVVPFLLPFLVTGIKILIEFIPKRFNSSTVAAGFNFMCIKSNLSVLCNILKQPTVKDLLSTAASHSEHLATLPQHSATPCFITRPLSAPSNHVIATLTKNEDHR